MHGSQLRIFLDDLCVAMLPDEVSIVFREIDIVDSMDPDSDSDNSRRSMHTRLF